MLWKGCSWVHRQHLLPLERLGACEGPGVQLDRLGTGSQSPPASAESSEQQDCSAGAVVVGMAKQNKQYLRLKAQRVLVSQPPISASASAVPKPWQRAASLGRSRGWQDPADAMLCVGKERSPSTEGSFPSACATPDKVARESNDN